MSLSHLPLSYCTNVHPGRSFNEVCRGLQNFTVPLRQSFGQPLAAGLWLAAPVIRELISQPAHIAALQNQLADGNLTCHTLNAFPFGDFHDTRVKEKVYIPDWTDPSRREYTVDCARVLAQLLPAGTEGSISTVPLGFKFPTQSTDFRRRAIAELLQCATQLAQITKETGAVIRLAIEPEPLCLLETTAETIAFFRELFDVAADHAQLDIAQTYLGVCYDVCHQAVEFESIPESIAALEAAEIRINKVHITCALEIEKPASNQAGREQLGEFAEERYLHQVIAQTATGESLRLPDLNRAFANEPPPEFLECDRWRIHFHVPVDAESIGDLKTTRNELRQALAAVQRLEYAPHLEVETYTWGVLPTGRSGTGAGDLVDGLTRELSATRNLITETARLSVSDTTDHKPT